MQVMRTVDTIRPPFPWKGGAWELRFYLRLHNIAQILWGTVYLFFSKKRSGKRNKSPSKNKHGSKNHCTYHLKKRSKREKKKIKKSETSLIRTALPGVQRDDILIVAQINVWSKGIVRSLANRKIQHLREKGKWKENIQSMQPNMKVRMWRNLWQGKEKERMTQSQMNANDLALKIISPNHQRKTNVGGSLTCSAGIQNLCLCPLILKKISCLRKENETLNKRDKTQKAL